MSTKDIDFGWKRITRELKNLDNSYTKIGIQEADAETKHGESTLIVIAATNEFGTDKAGKNRNIKIPASHFMANSFDKHKRKYNSMIDDYVSQMFKNKLKFSKALSKLGQIAENDIKKYMTDLKTPPNKPSTIKRKGADNRLIDSGQLRNSIRHVEVYR